MKEDERIELVAEIKALEEENQILIEEIQSYQKGLNLQGRGSYYE